MGTKTFSSLYPFFYRFRFNLFAKRLSLDNKGLLSSLTKPINSINNSKPSNNPIVNITEPMKLDNGYINAINENIAAIQ